MAGTAEAVAAATGGAAGAGAAASTGGAAAAAAAKDAGATSAAAATSVLSGEAAAGGKTGDGKNPAATATSGPPEKYSFVHPDAAKGGKYDEPTLAAYSEVARESGWTQEQAQKHLDNLTKTSRERAQQVMTELKTQWQKEADDARAAERTKWVEEAKADKDFGGEKWDQNRADALAFLQQFTDQPKELIADLDKVGIGFNLRFLKLLAKAGKAMQGDKFVGAGMSAGAEAGGARSFFKNMKQG